MTRIVNIGDYLVKDIKSILFEDFGNLTMREYEGYCPTEKKDKAYVLNVAREAYLAGADRVATELNKQADREVSQAQTRAIKKIVKEYGSNQK